MYQELMLGYLQDAKTRGFGSVYIWACPPPPRAGDSYILSVHPKWQRTPNTERLVKWYKTIEELGEKEGVIVSSEDLLQSHFFGHQQSRATRHASSRNGVLTKDGKNSSQKYSSQKKKRAKKPDGTKKSQKRRNSSASTSSSSSTSSLSLSSSSSSSLTSRPTQKKRRGRPPLIRPQQEDDGKADIVVMNEKEREFPLIHQSVYDLPYFQGDFWISEVEKILFELDGYGMPGDTDAAMRYWWKEQSQNLKKKIKNETSSSASSSSSSSFSTSLSSFSSSSSSSSSTSDPRSVKEDATIYPPDGLTDPTRKKLWRKLQRVYKPTLAAVLPEGSTSSLKQFERKGTPQSHGVGVGIWKVSDPSTIKVEAPNDDVSTTNNITRYNCIRFRMMNDNVSNILGRRQQDFKYKVELEEKLAQQKAEAERLALIPKHIPTFEEREAWLMSNLKTRVSPMADQFLIWHLNPTCHACGDVLMGGTGGGKCWLFQAATTSAGKKKQTNGIIIP